MAELRIPLSCHGPYGARKCVIIADDNGDGYVDLCVEGEGDDERDTGRSLLADEARAIAAAPNHFADEVER